MFKSGGRPVLNAQNAHGMMMRGGGGGGGGGGGSGGVSPVHIGAMGHPFGHQHAPAASGGETIMHTRSVHATATIHSYGQPGRLPGGGPGLMAPPVSTSTLGQPSRGIGYGGGGGGGGPRMYGSASPNTPARPRVG